MAKYFVANVFTFNNYYNRTVRKYNTLVEYIENAGLWDELRKVNFNPSDGITTTFIWGKGEGAPFINSAFNNYDYFILSTYDEDAPEDEREEIISRWFIVESQRTRGGQEKLTLRRDVLADKWEAIRRAPIFVEKGIINNFDSPLLMNNEDVRVNQIKKQEILLKDRTKCPWLVMYLKKGALGNSAIGPNQNGKITINVSQDDSFVFETLSSPITSWLYYGYQSADYKVSNSMVFKVNIRQTFGFDFDELYKINSNAPFNSSIEELASLGGTNLSSSSGSMKSDKNRLDSQFKNSTNMSNLIFRANSAFSYNSVNNLQKYNDKIIKDSQGKYFKVSVYQRTSGKQSASITSSNAPALKNSMNNLWNTAFEQTVAANDSAFDIEINWVGLRITLEELTDVETEVDLGAYGGNGTEDSILFDAIAIPYGDVFIQNPDIFLYGIHTSAERSLKIMSSIATQLSSEWVLDLQLLPYCPVQGLISNNEEPTINFTSVNGEPVIAGYRTVEGATTYTDALFICPSSNFTFDIEQNIKIEDNSDVLDVFKIKYINDCTLLRLCSPNYNGLFEMNLAKNGGQITSFNVDVTLRPFNPYIHVNPDFNFLYGQDFNDQRGLICGGDFSLGIINDAWNVYEIQNKNYQAIFDRQIQNLDVNNAIARQEAGWGMAAGIVSGGASGAAGGAIVGGGWGALAGAIIGAGTSAVGGALDLANLQKRQQETRSYAIDNYNLQLGNIRALPNSITKTSALTFNNKLFPFVEIYECSEVEKEAYYSKLRYNGMTVGITDKIVNYESGSYQNYFRGKVIRFPNGTAEFSWYNLVEDYHFAEIINEELMKGVFI